MDLPLGEVDGLPGALPATRRVPVIALDAPTLTGTDVSPTMLEKAEELPPRAGRRARRMPSAPLPATAAQDRGGGTAGFGVVAAAGVLITVLILTSGDNGNTPNNPTDNNKQKVALGG